MVDESKRKKRFALPNREKKTKRVEKFLFRTRTKLGGVRLIPIPPFVLPTTRWRVVAHGVTEMKLDEKTLVNWQEKWDWQNEGDKRSDNDKMKLEKK